MRLIPVSATSWKYTINPATIYIEFCRGLSLNIIELGASGRRLPEALNAAYIVAGLTMHEMSLCEGILQVLQKSAQSQGFRRVKTVWLEIGALSGVEVEAMRFSFDVVMRGSLADGAKLEIIDLPGQAWCMQCAKTVTVKQRFDACPKCDSYQLQVTAGDEMRIKELEVE